MFCETLLSPLFAYPTSFPSK